MGRPQDGEVEKNVFACLVSMVISFSGIYVIIKEMLLYIMLSCLKISTIIAQRKLIYANVMFNYGNRAPPAQVYPNDKYTEAFWPRGYAHLSNRGMQESYALGQFIRWRYATNGKLLPLKYTVDVIDVLSSSHDRTLQSAEAMLAALYPPIDEQVWLKDLLWQPIPVHTSDEADQDPMLQPDDINCINYKTLIAKENANFIASMNQKYANFFRYLENQTGIARIAFENISSLIGVENEITEQLLQPDWLSSLWSESNTTTLALIHDLARLDQDSRYNSVAKSRYGAGLMLARWISNMKTAINDSTSITKVSFFSVLEGSISSMLNALGTGIHESVPYSAAIFLDLYQDGSQYTVEAWYRNSSTATAAYQLQLTSCATTNCTMLFNDFVKVFQNLTFATTDDYLKACGLILPKTAAINDVSSIILLFVFILYMVCC